MSAQVIAGAALVGLAVPMAWASVSSRRVAGAASEILRRGFEPTIDVRAAVLGQSVQDRAVAPFVRVLARQASRLTPGGMMRRLERKLTFAGKSGVWTIEQVLAAKLGLCVAFGLLGFMWVAAAPSPLTLLLAFVGFVAGWFVPDVVLDGQADDRRQTVERSLPDTMDQVMIAVEAGLGFEAALARAAANKQSVLAEEISRTMQDIQLGVARAEALDGLANRCDSNDVRHFVSAVKQAERYGLPIANVLRIQAGELREKRRQRAEEHAMKIPVKVLFPLIFCILPTMFIVILGPSVIQMARGFGG